MIIVFDDRSEKLVTRFIGLGKKRHLRGRSFFSIDNLKHTPFYSRDVSMDN